MTKKFKDMTIEQMEDRRAELAGEAASLKRKVANKKARIERNWEGLLRNARLLSQRNANIDAMKRADEELKASLDAMQKEDDLLVDAINERASDEASKTVAESRDEDVIARPFDWMERTLAERIAEASRLAAEEGVSEDDAIRLVAEGADPVEAVSRLVSDRVTPIDSRKG